MAKPKKDSCPFCREDKKRPLNAYMRKRCQERGNGKICEEEEEEEAKNGGNSGQQKCNINHDKK